MYEGDRVCTVLVRIRVQGRASTALAAALDLKASPLNLVLIILIEYPLP